MPVRFLARKCGQRSLLPSVFTSILVIARATLAIPAAAQTATPAAQTTQPQATQDQSNLPPIRVTGNRPKHPGKVRKPYAGAEAPSAPNPVRTPPVPGNLIPGPLSGIPVTPLNAVATSASRLGLPVIETPASVDVVTAQTIQDQGYRTTTDTAQGAVGVLSGDAGGAPANFSMRDSASARSTRSITVSGPVLPTLLRDGWARPISARSSSSKDRLP